MTSEAALSSLVSISVRCGKSEGGVGKVKNWWGPTVGGGPGFSLNATPTELADTTMTWNGSNTTITGWNANLTGEAFGSAALADIEALAINNLINDQASIDNFVSNGLSTAAGSWSTIPEPSAFLFLGFVGVLSIGWSRWTQPVKTVN